MEKLLIFDFGAFLLLLFERSHCYKLNDLTLTLYILKPVFQGSLLTVSSDPLYLRTVGSAFADCDPTTLQSRLEHQNMNGFTHFPQCILQKNLCQVCGYEQKSAEGIGSPEAGIAGAYLRSPEDTKMLSGNSLKAVMTMNFENRKRRMMSKTFFGNYNRHFRIHVGAWSISLTSNSEE
ncbi:hypothetical protein STEG23_037970, partial [Scotinomys teguina]